MTDPRQLAEAALSNPNGPPGVLELSRELLSALDRATTYEQVPREWRFVYLNGSSVQASEEEIRRIGASASGHIEWRTVWQALAAAEETKP